ncbi:RERGL protein, partial [Anseranas semipalmata]|nr:RERGL protein [Anseranas semipalmata]
AALTVRFLTRRFIGEYGDAEAVYSRSGTVGGRAVRFRIWDSPRAQGAGEKPLRWADGVVLVYSICDRPSFHWARQQLQRLRQAGGRGGAGPVPVVLVGNKRDLQHRRAVPSEEGRLLALAYGAAFLEVSAAE